MLECELSSILLDVFPFRLRWALISLILFFFFPFSYFLVHLYIGCKLYLGQKVICCPFRPLKCEERIAQLRGECQRVDRQRKELTSLLEMEKNKWEAEKKEIEDEVSSEKRITQSVQEERDQHVWAVVNFFMSEIWKTNP